MPTKPESPLYYRQKEKGRTDRAYTIIVGRRIQLGTYDSPESYERFEKLKAQNKPVERAKTAPTAYTIAMLMLEYLQHAIKKYGGEKASEVVHTKLALKVLRATKSIRGRPSQASPTRLCYQL